MCGEIKINTQFESGGKHYLTEIYFFTSCIQTLPLQIRNIPCDKNILFFIIIKNKLYLLLLFVFIGIIIIYNYNKICFKFNC